MNRGEVQIRRNTSSGFLMTFASASGFWQRNTTHLAYVELDSRPFVLRYSSIDGSAAIHHVRTAGTGIDHVCRLSPAPGIGGLSMLGVGAPSTGSFVTPAATGGLDVDVFVYKAL